MVQPQEASPAFAPRDINRKNDQSNEYGSSIFPTPQRGDTTWPLIGKSMEHMEAWGSANVIYQPLIQQEVCRVQAAAWRICVTKLRAKGLEKPSGLRGL